MMIIMTYHGYCTRVIRCQVLLFVLEDIWSETKSWQRCPSPDKCPQPLGIVSFPTHCPGYYDHWRLMAEEEEGRRGGDGMECYTMFVSEDILV